MPMSDAPSRARPLLLASSIVAAALLVSGCDRGASGPAPGAAPAAPPPLPVTVIEMQPRSVPITLEAVARTEGSREVEVRARVSGILERQLFREGEPIRAGAPMYRIDRAPFGIALAQARAALAETRARAERAQLEATRLEKLLGDRAISQREYDDALSARQQTQASLLASQARVREAELNLSYTTVDAPISGVTGRAVRSEGSLVSAGSESSLLTTLTRTDPIWVRFSLSESEYAQLRGSGERAAKVRLVLPDGSTHQRVGRLNFTGSTVDPRLGTVQLRAEFANPSLALLPGQYVKARVEIGEREAFVVPQAAVQQTDRGRFVWLVDASDKVEQRPVETGGWVGRDWVVRDGLKAGDRVAIDNLLRLRPGAAVQPKAPAATAGAAPAAPAAPATASGSGAGGAR
ncbi:MAG: efflux RND transporter periplasmic adaptor subunit [Burkholderiales bacterium]|nr:MAG: efflux RND transporter periplasmic adaptor subunit [Burkholderiales bacterium]